MANAILNFHFVFLTPSLSSILFFIGQATGHIYCLPTDYANSGTLETLVRSDSFCRDAKSPTLMFNSQTCITFSKLKTTHPEKLIVWWNIMHSLNIRDDLPQGENKKFEWEILSLAKLSELCFLRNISFSTKMKNRISEPKVEMQTKAIS